MGVEPIFALTYLIGRVIHYKVNHKFHSSLFQLRNELVDIAQGSVCRINILVIRLLILLADDSALELKEIFTISAIS